jgi:uncharacterized repeat protein (TIGR04052 family)
MPIVFSRRPRVFTRARVALAVSAMAATGAPLRAAPAAAADSLVPISIRFQALVNSVPFACGTSYQQVGTSKATVIASDFRFYVHDVRLITAKGDTVRGALRPEAPWQDADVALLDFENGTASCSNGTPEMRDRVVVLAPAGTYTGVAFSMGVPFKRNHLDVSQAPPPLSLSRLFWSWTGGYKFMRVDMRATAADSAATPWVIHLGSTGCSPAASATTPVAQCTQPNRSSVVLDRFDPARDIVTADLGVMLARTDVRKNQPQTAAGCMSADTDSDCGGLFASLGLPHRSSTGADSPRFFSVSRAGSTGVGSLPK